MKQAFVTRATAVLLCTLLSGVVLAEPTALGKAASDYVVVAAGVVKSKQTSLEWMRCSMGQSWNEKKKTCEGRADKYDYNGAQDIASKLNRGGGFNGKTDWRVPSVSELQSLRVCSKGFRRESVDLQAGGASVPVTCNDGSTRPTIAESVFPLTLGDDLYWSSSPWAGHSSRAWAVGFGVGITTHFGRTNALYVRLVR